MTVDPRQSVIRLRECFDQFPLSYKSTKLFVYYSLMKYCLSVAMPQTRLPLTQAKVGLLNLSPAKIELADVTEERPFL